MHQTSTGLILLTTDNLCCKKSTKKKLDEKRMIDFGSSIVQSSGNLLLCASS